MASPSPRLFTVDEYHRMARAGILGEEDRVELIQGEVLRMTPISSRHAACVNKLTALFAENLSKRFLLSVQNPVHLDDYSEPQPDVALLAPRDDFYAGRLPGPSDVRLLVEVAQASRDFDRGPKGLLYARAGVPEYWIIDLEKSRLTRFTQPSRRGYLHPEEYSAGSRFDCEGVEFSVDDLLA